MKSMEILIRKEKEKIMVLSPAVGYVSHLPKEGEVVTEKSQVGNLQILDTTYSLFLGPNIFGKVVE